MSRRHISLETSYWGSNWGGGGEEGWYLPALLVGLPKSIPLATVWLQDTLVQFSRSLLWFLWVHVTDTCIYNVKTTLTCSSDKRISQGALGSSTQDVIFKWPKLLLEKGVRDIWCKIIRIQMWGTEAEGLPGGEQLLYAAGRRAFQSWK